MSWFECCESHAERSEHERLYPGNHPEYADPGCTNPEGSHGTHGGDGGPCLGCGWSDPAYRID